MFKRDSRWNTEIKRPKHTRVAFHIAHCDDCGRELRNTHVVSRFGGRCRGCHSSYHAVDLVMTDTVAVN